MKKILSVAMAAAMVASMATVAFAANAGRVGSIDDTGLLYNGHEDDKDSSVMTVVGSDRLNNGEYVRYGSTVYFPMIKADRSLTVKETVNEVQDSHEISNGDFVTESDAVKSVSIKQKWEMGSKHVAKVEIVKKKMTTYNDNGTATTVTTGNQPKYFYFVALSLKDSTSKEIDDVIGKITLRKSSGDFAFDGSDHEVYLDVNLEVGYAVADNNVIGKDYHKYEFANETEDYINFEADENSYFVVDTCDQKEIVGKADTKVNTDITAKYPDAYIDFFNGYGLTFNKIGEMTLYSEKGKYLYEIKNDNLVAVKATYDEYEDSFKFKTRTIGNYVISDTELKISTSTPEENTSSSTTTTPSKPNPGTGAIA